MTTASDVNPFTVSQMAIIGDVPRNTFKTLLRRSKEEGYWLFPYHSSLSSEETEDQEALGWHRYSPLDALHFVCARQLQTGNSSVDALGFPAAAKIVRNIRWADILCRLESGVLPGEVMAGYAWCFEGEEAVGGLSVAGTWQEIAERCNPASLYNSGDRDPPNVRSLSLVNINHCMRLTRARAKDLGWIVSADWQSAQRA